MKLKQEVAGLFSAKVHGGARGEVDLIKEIGHESGWMPNLILDSGIGLFLAQTSGTSGSAYGFIQLGTGTSAPNVAQTGLDARGAGKGHTNKGGGGGVTVTSGYDSGSGFSWTRVTVVFDAAEAVGTWSEVGAAPAATGPTFSRALFLDGSGLPTTITKLAGEVLTVVYEFRRWWVTPPPTVITYDNGGAPQTSTLTFAEPSVARLEMGAPQNALLGAPVTNNISLATLAYSDVVGNTRRVAVSVGLSEGVPEVASVYLSENGDGQPARRPFIPTSGPWVTFDPPLPKTSEFSLVFDVELSLTRR